MWNMIFGRFVHRCTEADGDFSGGLGSGELDGLDLISIVFMLQDRKVTLVRRLINIWVNRTGSQKTKSMLAVWYDGSTEKAMSILSASNSLSNIFNVLRTVSSTCVSISSVGFQSTACFNGSGKD